MKIDIDNKKLFRIAGTVFKVLCVIFLLGLAIQLVCMLWLCLLPDKLSEFFERVQIWRPFVTDMYPYSRAIAELSASMLTYAFAVFFTKSAVSVFASLERGEGISTCVLKNVSIASICCSVIIPVVRNLAFGVFVGGTYSKSGLDIGMLLFGLVLLALSLSVCKKSEKN